MSNLATTQVFISYRHVKPDEDLALAIKAALIQDDLEVFLDRNMQVGTVWSKEIDRKGVALI